MKIPKKSNIERHFKTFHLNFDADYPVRSEIRKKKISSLKPAIIKQQSFFAKPMEQSKAATTASFKISYLLAKKKKTIYRWGFNKTSQVLKDSNINQK